MFGDFTKNFQKYESANENNYHCKDCIHFEEEKCMCHRFRMITSKEKWCKSFREKETN